MYVHGSNMLLGIESGHVLCLPVYEPRKPKFILQASLTRITDVKVMSLGKNIMATCSNDDSFSLFDFEQRVNGDPKFIQKYKTISTPTQI